MILTFILKIPPKILKNNPPNCTFSAKNKLPMIRKWKYDISHHDILLNLNFTRFFHKIPFLDLENQIPNLEIYLFYKTYLGQGEFYLKIIAKLVKWYPKSRFFQSSEKTWSRIWIFLALNYPLIKMELTKKGLSKLVQLFWRR